MPQLVSRILLASLIVPIALLANVIVVNFLQQFDFQHEEEIWGGGIMMNLFIVVAWIALWWRFVRWSAVRTAATALAFAGAAGTAAAAGWYVNEKIWLDLGLLTGVILTPALWMFITALIWRESAGERARRYTKPASVN